MPPTPATRPPTLANLARTDSLAAIVCAIVFVLSAAGIPTALGLSAAATSAIGAAVVLSAAAVRGGLRMRKGEEVALQDLLAAAIGAILFALSLAGLPNALAIDANGIAMAGSALATAAAGWRVRTEAKAAATT